MYTLDLRSPVSENERLHLSRLFNLSPREAQVAIVETLKRLNDADLDAPVATATVPAPVFKFDSLPPIADIFTGMVWGENRTAFVELEHLVNEMRTRARTYNIGLFGPPSAGKTLTAGRIARGLERRYLEVSATFLGEYSNPMTGLLTIISKLHDGNPVVERYVHDDGRSEVEVLAPSIFFVDEAHEMPANVQNMLLPITYAPNRAQVGDGYVDFRHVMFILGTTDPSNLQKPLRTRLREVAFVGYGLDSVTKMVKMKFPEFNQDEAELVAKAGKLYPRRAINIGQSCLDLRDRYGTVQDVLRKHLGVDADGLDNTDRKLLDVLAVTCVAPDPRKVDKASRIVAMSSQGMKVSATTLADAESILANLKVHRPIGRVALSDKIMSTDSRDVMERLGYLEQLGKILSSSRGVQLAG